MILLLFFSNRCCSISSIVVAVSVFVTNVSNYVFLLLFGTAAAKFGVVAADVVVIGTAVSVHGVTTVLWCC